MADKQSNWPKGVKRTKQRESVMLVLENAMLPLSASDIFAKMETDKETAWLSTVYRILELFVEKGIVVKTSVMNSDMAVYVLNQYRHKHYAVCVNCHKIVAMDNCPMEKFTPKLEDEAFQVMGHNLEVYGFCKDCSGK